MSEQKAITLTQRQLRRPINWAVERYFPDGVFFGDAFIRSMDRINNDPNATGVVTGVATYLIYRARRYGATHLETTVIGLTVQGEPCGDWRITVEQTAPPKQEPTA